MTAGAQKPLILVLEDEAVIAMALESSLLALGYAVQGPATTGEEALRLARQQRPDLLIADIRLGGGRDGIGVAATLRKELGMPVVFLSAYADSVTIARAVETDPFGYLTKPVREPELHATLTTALHRDRLEKALAERERQLADSEARFRSLFEASPDALLVVDPRGMVTLANRHAATLFECAESELTGAALSNLIPEDQAPRAAMSFSWAVTCRGRRVPVEVTSAPTPLGREQGTVLSVRDVSERLRKDLEILKLAAVVEHARESIALATVDGRLIFLNESGRRLLGVDPAKTTHDIAELFPEHQHGKLHSEIFPALLAGTTWEGEIQHVNLQTGAVIDVQCNTFPVTNPMLGEPSYLACVCQDITERKRTEAALARSRDELARSQKLESLGRLTGGLAHDFNNMLTVILGLSRLLAPLLAEQPHALSLVRDIREAGERSYDLVQRLLAFARRQPMQPRVVELNAQIRDFAGLMMRTLGSNLELILELDPREFPLWIDPPQLEQVLLNLLINARDAMPVGGRVWIRTRAVPHPRTERAGYGIEVEDEGCGMSDEVQRRLFEPFFTTKEFGDGTGLGLSIVYGVVTQADGDIRVQSTEGRGTTFHLWLPAHAEKQKSEQPRRNVVRPTGPEEAC